ncbi:MAG: MBL fold metallo-hydrolase [Anaerolineae bacterium]
MDQELDTYVMPLGVSGALVDVGYHNSYLAVVRQERFWMVDCAGCPVTQLKRAGLDPLKVQAIVITHFHPDHVYGLPAFLLGLYVQGVAEKRPRQQPLPIYARPEVLRSVRALVGLFEYQDWVWALPLEYHPVTVEVGALVAEDKLFRVTAAPSRHSIPSLALRFEVPRRTGAFVYSSDTLPCYEVERLAHRATLLFHESGGSGHGHSMPGDVAALAKRAHVERLVLIHYALQNAAQIRTEAKAVFGEDVTLAQELQRYAF